jgi:hypothetical protein
MKKVIYRNDSLMESCETILSVKEIFSTIVSIDTYRPVLMIELR